MKLKVFVADDSVIVRERIVERLSQIRKIEIIGQTGDGNIALTLIHKLYPDVVIVDIRMPGKNGINVLRCIKKENPDIKVIVITSYPYAIYKKVCMEEGADLFFEKSGDFRTIVNFLDNVSNNKKFLIPVIHHAS